jgi:hypothetical protein
MKTGRLLKLRIVYKKIYVKDERIPEVISRTGFDKRLVERNIFPCRRNGTLPAGHHVQVYGLMFIVYGCLGESLPVIRSA